MNKKNFWHPMTILMVLMLCVGFASCGSDDDGGGSVSGFSIVGTWYEYESDVEGLDAIFVFNSDNTGTVTEYYEGALDGVDNFTYTFSGNTLKIYFEGEEDDPDVLKINIKSATEFTYSEGGSVLTFKKQK